MTWTNYNNIGIGAIAVLSIMNYRETISLPKCLLIMPLVMHKDSLGFLSNKNTSFKSVAALVTTHPELFINFDKRYSSALAISLNSIQLLIELKLVRYSDGFIYSTKKINITADFGKRARKIALASEKISHLLNSSDEELYLNLRIKL
jgi:Family of unknown function (DUF6521)